jgi:hypothetical protein
MQYPCVPGAVRVDNIVSYPGKTQPFQSVWFTSDRVRKDVERCNRKTSRVSGIADPEDQAIVR